MCGSLTALALALSKSASLQEPQAILEYGRNLQPEQSMGDFTSPLPNVPGIDSNANIAQ